MKLLQQFSKAVNKPLGGVASDRTLHSIDLLWLELTLKCNLECIHCYASSNMLMKDHLKTEDWMAVLHQGAEIGCKGVQFIGGEPTIAKDLLFLVEKSRELGYEYVEVYTNATLLTDAMLDELKSYNVRLATSFYSHLAETHDSITQRKGSFQKTVNAIKRIVARKIPLRVGIVRLPQNATQIEPTTDFLVKLGVERDKILTDRVRGHGRGSMIVNEHNEYSGLCGNCGYDNLAISNDGSVYPCVHARQFKLGSILEEPLSQMAGSQELIDFRRAMISNLDDPVKKAYCET